MKNPALIVLVVLSGLLLGACHSLAENKPAEIQNFEQCVAAGYPMTMSYPSTCRTPDGKIFTNQKQKLRMEERCANQCGNGTCEEIVCMGLGCPCPENPQICPQDCKGN